MLLHDQSEVLEDGTNEVEPKRKAGRPVGTSKLQPDEETLKQISSLGRIQCTQKEAAAVLGVHVDTFSDFLRAHEKADLAWHDGREVGLASLRRQQFKMAETNATMQIWLGKQYLDQRDKAETDVNHAVSMSAEFEGFIRSLNARRDENVIEHKPAVIDAAE